MLELAARFSETLYRGPLAHEVAQADGAVKGQDKRASPAHDRSTGLCNMVAKEEKALCVFLSANHIKMPDVTWQYVHYIRHFYYFEYILEEDTPPSTGKAPPVM